MPIESEILRDGRVVVFTLPSSFTMIDLNEMNETCLRLLLSEDTGKVHTISDLSFLKHAPANVRSLSMNMIKAVPVPVGIGTMFIVTPNNSIKTVACILIRLFPMLKFAVCSRVAEALEEVDRLIAQESVPEAERKKSIASEAFGYVCRLLCKLSVCTYRQIQGTVECHRGKSGGR